MAKGTGGAIIEILLVAVVIYVLIRTLPSAFAQISAANAAIARQNNPGAAGDSAIARIITAGGNAGAGLVGQFGGYLLQENPYQPS